MTGIQRKREGFLGVVTDTHSFGQCYVGVGYVYKPKTQPTAGMIDIPGCYRSCDGPVNPDLASSNAGDGC